MKKENPVSALPEEETTPVRAADLLYGVFFIGVLLTFAIYVSVTMLLGAQTTVGDRYLSGRDHRIPLSEYNEAYYKNTTLQEIITRIRISPEPNTMSSSSRILSEPSRPITSSTSPFFSVIYRTW